MGFNRLIRAYKYRETEKVGLGKKLFSDYECKDGYTYAHYIDCVILVVIFYFLET